MCELLGMSSRRPTNLRLSLDEFASHGGPEGQERDGWGMVFYQGRDLHRYRAPAGAAESPLVRFIASHDHSSDIALAHIRHATIGARTLANTQPFVREQAGVMHSFAHNGHLPELHTKNYSEDTRHYPIGQTDSELAFCHLLQTLASISPDSALPPSPSARLEVFESFCKEMRTFGPANILYSDSEFLFAHADRRRQPDGRIATPGLYVLERHCATDEVQQVGAAELVDRHEDQRVLLFASVPLSDDSWRPMQQGQVLMARQGMAVAPQPQRL